MAVVWNASSCCVSLRVKEVLSRSTTPTGMSSGCPSRMSDVKNIITAMGNTTMHRAYIGLAAMRLHSRAAMLHTRLLRL